MPCLHSVGHPLADGADDVPWPCNADNKYIVHFPETREIWSYGSGYGGNALLGKKCFALRIASVMARDEGWMAEHMLILKLTSPEGGRQVRHRRLPSACGKTNLAMLIPTLRLEGRDDRRRHRVDEVRRRRAPVRGQPRGRLLRRRAGHGLRDQPQRDGTIGANTIFTNCALTDDGDVWWEGMTPEPPAHLIDWHGNDWTPDSEARPRIPTLASPPAPTSVRASRRSGRTRPGCRSTPSCSAGGARPSCRSFSEAFDWEHGVFLGATMASETTAAAAGTVGELRFDPFAMLPFCGYNMADYFAHWLRSGAGPTPPSCRRSSTSTGFARTTTGTSCGPASARTAACWSGSSAAATTPRMPSTHPSVACRRRARSTSRVSRLQSRTLPPC